MFLHKKSAAGPFKRLKTALKLDFGGSAYDLRHSCNVERYGNGIISGFTQTEIPLPVLARQVIATNGDVLYVMTDLGVYSVVNGVSTRLINIVQPDLTTCTFRGSVLVSARDMGIYFVSATSSKSVYESGFDSLLVLNDRIFGMFSKEVRYTGAGQRDGWVNGEMIKTPTTCDALLAVDHKVYVLGDTCYVLTHDAEDIEFKFRVFAHNVGAVSRFSVVNYNGGAVFASSNGMYRLSSNKITPIFEQLNDVVDLSKCVATFFDGKYYLSCRTKGSSEESNDVTLILDVDTEEITGVLHDGYESLVSSKSLIYATRNGRCYAIKKGVSDGRYVKSNVDFATSEKKFLDRLTVKTLSDLDVAIRSENETRLYKVKGKKSTQKINLRDMGWVFSIELSSNDGLNVENLELFAHTCGEV